MSAREFRRQNSCNVKIELLRTTSVDSSMRSDYDGSCVTRHFADTERSIPSDSESIRTSANDNGVALTIIRVDSEQVGRTWVDVSSRYAHSKATQLRHAVPASEE